MTQHQPESQPTESPSLLQRLTAWMKRWTRRALSPWVQQRLTGQPAAQTRVGPKSAGFSQATVSGQRTQTVLKLVKHRTGSGSGRRATTGKSLSAIAGAIFHRHRASRPAAAVTPPQPARPSSDLVLAAGSVPAPAQPGQTPAPAALPGGVSVEQFIPPMPPTDTGFFVGQRIPPMPPTDTGFSVGQRIPPMPKTEPKKQPPAGQKTRREAAPSQPAPQKPARKRVFSRVEEVLPQQPALARPKSVAPEPLPNETPAAPKAADAAPPAADVTTENIQPAVPPITPAPPAEKPVQRKIDRPERAEPDSRPPAGPTPLENSTGSQPAAPEPLPHPDAATPVAPPDEPLSDTLPDTPAQPKIDRPERAEPDHRPPAGPQPLDIAGSSQPTAPATLPRPDAASSTHQPEQLLSAAPDAPVQRQIDLPNRGEPDHRPPAAPQPLDITGSSQPAAPVAQPEQLLSAAPDTPAQPKIDLPEREPDEITPERAFPQAPPQRKPAPPTGPQPLDIADSSQPAAPATLPRPDAAGPVIQPEQLLSAALDAPMQRQIDLPGREPGAITPERAFPQTPPQQKPAPPAGPQPLEAATDSQPAAPEILARPDAAGLAHQPEQLLSAAPQRTAPPEPVETDVTDRRHGSPEPIGPQPAAVKPDKMPATLPQDLPLRQRQPEAEVVEPPAAPPAEMPAASPTPPAAPPLERLIQQRAEARSRLPLHRPQPLAGPKLISRQTGPISGGHGGVQQIFRSAQPQTPAKPQPLAGELPVNRPGLPEPLPHSSGGQSAFSPTTASPLPGPSPQPAGDTKSEDPHLAALRAIERKFGPAAMASPQARLGGLAELGMPKPKTPPPSGPEAVAGQPPAPQPQQPFDINAISLGQPKIKVVKREAPKTPALAEKNKQKPAARKTIQRRTDLVLARKPLAAGGQAATRAGRSKAAAKAGGAAKRPARNQQPDLSRLALAVYPMIKRLLALERERRPGY